MAKKAYIAAGVAVIVIAAVVGIYWYSQKAEIAVSPESQELAYETESLSQDIADLEEIEKEAGPETLEEDLLAMAEGVSGIAPETPTVDISGIENLEEELDAELDGLGTDLTDLEGFEGDTSLDNLDDSLSGF